MLCDFLRERLVGNLVVLRRKIQSRPDSEHCKNRKRKKQRLRRCATFCDAAWQMAEVH
jgi:hypothetical protein